MKEEYDLTKMKRRKNPYAKNLKKQITIRLDDDTIKYFKGLALETGLPYQNLINLYLRDCADQHRKLSMKWASQKPSVRLCLYALRPKSIPRPKTPQRIIFVKRRRYKNNPVIIHKNFSRNQLQTAHMIRRAVRSHHLQLQLFSAPCFFVVTLIVVSVKSHHLQL